MEADGTGYSSPDSRAPASRPSRVWVQEPGATILSDDRVILAATTGILDGGRPGMARRAGLAGPRASVARVPAAAARAHELRDVARPAAVARLLAAVSAVHDATALDFSLSFSIRWPGGSLFRARLCTGVLTAGLRSRFCAGAPITKLAAGGRSEKYHLVFSTLPNPTLGRALADFVVWPAPRQRFRVPAESNAPSKRG